LSADLDIPISSLVRSHRRTIALVVTTEATLVIRAPMKTSWETIQRAVATKKDWIIKKIQAAQRAQLLTPVRQYTEGQNFLYLGQELSLHLRDVQKIRAHAVIDFPEKYVQQGRKHMLAWYIAEAKKIIPERVEKYQQETGWRSRSIKIGSAEKRWGSCARSGDIRFSWKLIMAPIDILDYVVVHELAHLIQHNHSSKFWKNVANVLPDYKVRRKWLRDHQRQLYL